MVCASGVKLQGKPLATLASKRMRTVRSSTSPGAASARCGAPAIAGRLAEHAVERHGGEGEPDHEGDEGGERQRHDAVPSLLRRGLILLAHAGSLDEGMGDIGAEPDDGDDEEQDGKRRQAPRRWPGCACVGGVSVRLRHLPSQRPEIAGSRFSRCRSLAPRAARRRAGTDTAPNRRRGSWPPAPPPAPLRSL